RSNGRRPRPRRRMATGARSCRWSTAGPMTTACPAPRRTSSPRPTPGRTSRRRTSPVSVILVFIIVLLGLAGWWLTQQRLMSRPWLETGTVVGGGGFDDTGLPTAKIALIVFLAVVGSLFALFASAYIMRTEFSDW